MKNRRSVLCAGAMAALGALGACTHTRQPAERYSTDTETVVSVLISEDGAKIVFIGNWHYVFDAPQALSKAIRSPYHAALTATLGQVEVDVDRDAQMPYRLVLANASAEQKAMAVADGFTAAGDELVLEGLLRGRVYVANGVMPPSQSVGLNRTYKVTVRREQRPLGAQDVPSPIRAVGKVGIAILSVPLVVVAMPFIIVAGAIVLRRLR